MGRCLRHCCEVNLNNKLFLESALEDYMNCAFREIEKSDNYVFATKKKATAELERLSDILREMIQSQSVERRLASGIACPLGHAMDLILPDEIEVSVPATPANTSTSKFIATGAVNERKLDEEFLSLLDTAGYGSTSKDTFQYNLFLDDDQQDDVDDTEITVNFAAVKEPSTTKEELISLVQSTIMDEVSAMTEKDAVVKKRVCGVCGTKFLKDGGRTCRLCEYDLCLDCTTIYCRAGHGMKIWTMPDAVSMVCDMCKKQPIEAGYRCLTCSTDICDSCTSKESRNSFMLWPRRELNRVIKSLRYSVRDSSLAKEYIEQLDNEADKSYMLSMSRLCAKLKEAEEVKKVVDEEFKQKIIAQRAKEYGLKAKEML